MTNKEAADILRLMPKQSHAILKAIEVLESENYYKSLAESYGDTINKLTTAISEIKQEPKMEVCPSCGLDVHSDFRFCPRCGAKMVEPKESEKLTAISRSGKKTYTDMDKLQ